MKKNIIYALLLFTQLYSNDNVPFGIKSYCPTYITEDDYTMCYNDEIKNVLWISYTKDKDSNINNPRDRYSQNNLINKLDKRIYKKDQPPILTDKELSDSGYMVYPLLPNYLHHKDSEFLSLSVLLYPNAYQILKTIDKYEAELILSKKINVIRGTIPSTDIFIGENNATVPESIYVIIYEFDNERIQVFFFKNDNSTPISNKEDIKIELQELEKITKNRFFVKNKFIRNSLKEEQK